MSDRRVINTSPERSPAGPGAPPERKDHEKDIAFEIRGLTAGYGDLIAVRDISVRVHRGEIVALLGPNGAGKSTTLLAAVGVIPRVCGEVLWSGEQTKAKLHRLCRQGLAFVPEGRSVIAGLTVRDNLSIGSGGVSGALNYFPELEALLGRKAGLLSGGEQQMLTLGRALATRPEVLLADELSLGLAPLMVDRLLTALRSAVDDHGTSVLLVEQQVRRALSIADRWYLLSNGTVVDSGLRSTQGAFEKAYQTSIGGRVIPTT
jgi:branched-chain amino acid transport system ATP-binding protein